jgi:hypothetical protein
MSGVVAVMAMLLLQLQPGAAQATTQTWWMRTREYSEWLRADKHRPSAVC